MPFAFARQVYLEGKAFSHRQRAALVGLQGDLLRQHDIARDKTGARYETPAASCALGRFHLTEIHADAMAYPVSLSGVATRDVEITVPVILCGVLGR